MMDLIKSINKELKRDRVNRIINVRVKARKDMQKYYRIKEVGTAVNKTLYKVHF